MECAMQQLLLVSFACLCSLVSGFVEIYPPVNNSDVRTPLYFGLIQSFGGEYKSSGAIAGVRVALDKINRKTSMLPGYSLHYVLTDSQCNRSIALQALFQQILPDPAKVALIGSGCSVATEPTAEVSPYYNITQISCVSSSTELANRIRFRNYFQMLPTEADIAPGYFGVIRQYGWRHVALIVQNENLFTVTMDRLKVLLARDDISFSETMFETADSISGLGLTPFDPEARIFVLAMYSRHARALLCEAHRLGYRHPHYIFLTYAWYRPQWWRNDEESLPCTADERESVLVNSIAFLHFDYLPLVGLNITTDTGLTGHEYLEKEEKHFDLPPLYLFHQEGGPFCYDATWTLAMALQETINDFEDNVTLSREAWQMAGIHSNETFGLEHFSYNNSVVLGRIFDNMADTTFTGLTGSVSFGASDGIRDVYTLRVFQLRYMEANGSEILDWDEVAHVDVDNDFAVSYLEGESDQTLWPGGIPYDGVPEEEDVSVSLGLTVVFSFSATAGIIFALACLTFNFYFRNKTLIRLSSPNLNTLIGVGAIVLYVDLYLVVVPTTDPTAVAVLCNLTPWFTAIGYSLCYGTILVKMGRVYYIFSNPTARKKKLADWVLGACVGVMVGLDLVILVGYTAVEGGRNNLGAERIPNEENREDIEGDLGIITRYFVWICDSNARDIFLGFLYGYKALLQVVALLLAFRTRRVKVKGLNDAKEIAGAIYVTSIVLAMVMVATYTLNERINAFAALFCTGFFIGTTVILLLVFVPKMVGLYLDPDGKKIFERTRPTHMVTAGSGESPDQSKQLSQFQSNGVSKSQPNGVSPVQSGMDPGIVESLQRKVKELEAIVSQYQHPAIEDGPEAIQLQDCRVQFTKVVTEEGEGGEVVTGEGEEEQERTIWDDEPPTSSTDM